MNAIEFINVVKTYPRSWLSAPVDALKGITLKVNKGEFFGFIGMNGAGKSTAIKILVGGLFPSAGKSLIFGKTSYDPVAREGMGYVPESPYLPEHLTPLEILMMALEIHGVKHVDKTRHCLKVLEQFQIQHVARKIIKTFSKGMMQRVALAHALCIEPRLLILDEPLSGLDPVGRIDVVDILSEYKRKGGTVFLTSHVLHDVERLADRFGLIHNGEIVLLKNSIDLANQEQLFVVRSVGQELVNGMLRDDHGRWIGQVSKADLWKVLSDLEHAQHQLIEVRPSLSLERIFIQKVANASNAQLHDS